MPTAAKTRTANSETAVRVRRVQAADIPQVIGLDTRVTKLAKADYWNDIFRRYGKRRLDERFFLVAESGGARRAARARLHHRRNPRLGIRLDALRLGFRAVGRTGDALAQYRLRHARSDFRRIQESGHQQDAHDGGGDDRLPMLFFRSEGMMAGPYIQLEKDLD